MAFTALLSLFIVQRIYLISNNETIRRFEKEFLDLQKHFENYCVALVGEQTNPDEEGKIHELNYYISSYREELKELRERIEGLIENWSIYAQGRYRVLLEEINRQIRFLGSDNLAIDLLSRNRIFYPTEIEEIEPKCNPARAFEISPPRNSKNSVVFEKKCPNAPKHEERKFNIDKNSIDQDIPPLYNTSTVINSGSSIMSSRLRAAQAVIGSDSNYSLNNFNGPNDMEGRENRKNEMRNNMGNDELFRTPERRMEEDESSKSTSGKKVDKRKTRR